MNPVIQRELRAEARRPVSYWLRMGTAAAFFVLLELSLHGLDRVDATCRVLFPLLHGLLLMVSTCVAPLLIVEALSREKREGTFELLLLTPLTLDEVLSAKTFVFAVRTLVLVIGAFPVITFTLLFGGVALEEVLLLVLVQASAVVLALSVGLLAAAWGRTRLPYRAQDDRDWALAFWMSSLFLAVPVIGLESAFQFRTFWRAGGAVLFGGVGITGLLLWMGFMEDRPGFFCGLGVVFL